jgi:hypothetical protein
MPTATFAVRDVEFHLLSSYYGPSDNADRSLECQPSGRAETIDELAGRPEEFRGIDGACSLLALDSVLTMAAVKVEGCSAEGAAPRPLCRSVLDVHTRGKWRREDSSLWFARAVPCSCVDVLTASCRAMAPI